MYDAMASSTSPQLSVSERQRGLIISLWVYAFILFLVISAIMLGFSGFSWGFLLPAAGICLAGGLVGTLVIWIETLNDEREEAELMREAQGEAARLASEIVIRERQSARGYKSLFR